MYLFFCAASTIFTVAGSTICFEMGLYHASWCTSIFATIAFPHIQQYDPTQIKHEDLLPCLRITSTHALYSSPLNPTDQVLGKTPTHKSFTTYHPVHRQATLRCFIKQVHNFPRMCMMRNNSPVSGILSNSIYFS